MKIEGPFVPTAHPVLKLPTREQALAMGPDKLREVLIQREELIAKENEDPFRGGYYLDCWRDADAWLEKSLLLAMLGGNGSAKTFYMARKGVEVMLNKPGSKVLWLHEAEKPSILLHHATVWHYLPKELKSEARSTKRSPVRKINYTVATGFSDGKFVFPNGSIGVFGAYKQDIKDYEGTGWTLVCPDEDQPLAWLKMLMYRLPRCGGKMLWGFTPINGMTQAQKHLKQNAQVLETQPVDGRLLAVDKVHVEGCPVGTMPYVMKAVWPDTHLIHFPSSANPFGGYEDMVKLLVGRPAVEIKRRAYGWAEDSVGSCFPRFSAAHVLSRGRMAEVLRGRGTRRHYADPAGARNMFQIWTFTDEQERHFIYREWPDVPTYGEWAVTAEDNRKWDGQPGPAQPFLGFGIIDYKRMMLTAEGWSWEGGGWQKDRDSGGTLKAEDIFERKFDPRSGKAGAMTEDEGGVSLMDMFLDEQKNEKGELVGPSLLFDQASGITEDQGIMRINDLLAWNPAEKLCSLLNEPKLYIGEDCQSLIWALQTYTRHDGEKAACKDPIDCLRYFATDEADFVDDGAGRTRGGGSY